MAMRTIELDPSRWNTILDFYDELSSALGAPPWHGYNINAFIDSMIYGGINEINPPYTIRILGTGVMPQSLRDQVKEEIKLLIEARDQATSPDGGALNLQFETDL